MLNFTNPITWANNLPADLTKPAGKARYGDGFQRTNPLGHAGSGGPVAVGGVSTEALNARIAAGTLGEAESVLRAAGWDGAALTDRDVQDLFYLRHGSTTYLDAIATALGVKGAPGGEGDAPAQSHLYEGAPPLSGPGSVYERLALYGLITAATPVGDPEGTAKLSQNWYAIKYFENKLVPGENEEAFMAEKFNLRPLPEQWPVREDGVALFRALELRIAEWGLATAENASDLAAKQEAAKDAYFAFEAAFIPAVGQSAGAPPAFGDRVCNPRSVRYAGRMVENAIVMGQATGAAVSGPRLAMHLGQPQVFSRFEGEGFRQTAAPMQAAEWKLYLGIRPSGGSGGGLFIGGRES